MQKLTRSPCKLPGEEEEEEEECTHSTSALEEVAEHHCSLPSSTDQQARGGGGAAERGRGREGDRRLLRGDRVTGSATRRPHRSCHIHTLSKGSAGTKPCYLPRARLRRLRQPGPSSKAAMEIGRFPPQILSFLERSLPIKGTYCRIRVQTQAT